MHAPGNAPFFAVYYTTLAAFGLPANMVTIAILSQGRCGLSKCITRYLVFMAVSDLLVNIAAVILSRLRPISFLATNPACSVVIAVSWACKDTSVWLTVAFTFDRFIVICCQRLQHCYCTGKTATAVIGVVCALVCFKNIPLYFVYEPLYVIDKVPWYCSIKEIYYTSTSWRVYDWLHRILNPCLPLLLILLLNALTVRHILAASGARKRLRAQGNGDNQRVPEMESRRKSIILLFAISGSFMLLHLTFVVNFLFVQFSSKNYANSTNSTDPRFILQESGYMLELLSSCTNSCIYAGTQTKFREQLKNAVTYPFKLTNKIK